MFHGDSSRFLILPHQTSLDAVLSDAVERILSLGFCPAWSLSTVIDTVVWESLLYRMASDPMVTAELVSSFHLDLNSRVAINAVLSALRRSEVYVSPVRELAVAMAVSAFLSQAPAWVMAELRERGHLEQSSQI